MTIQVRTKLKKYAKMDGYVANTYSPYAMLKHLCFKFNVSEYEIKKSSQERKGGISMVFLTEQDIVSKKDKKEVLVVHNSQVFFHDLVDIMSSKYGKKTKAKLEVFMEHFFRHLGGDIDVRFLHMGEKHIVSIPEGRIIYYPKSKKIRVYLKDTSE